MLQVLGRRLLCVMVLGYCVVAGTYTWRTWRADSAAMNKNFATAIRWRPDESLYHRELAESELVTHPVEARAQLVLAIAANPYDALAAEDMTVSDLALGHDQAALANQVAATRKVPSFTDLWSLANLEMTHGNLTGFWHETQLACAIGDDMIFATVVARSLIYSHGDFERLRAALPAHRMAAAAAFLQAAIQARDQVQAEAGFHWLLDTHTGSLGDYETQRAAADQYLHNAWALWPGDVAAAWDAGRKAQLMNGPDKDAGAHMVLDGDFEPANTDPMRLSPAMGWQPDPLLAQRRVLTSGGPAATALAIEFHPFLPGNPPIALPQTLNLTQQWVLAPGGQPLTATVSGRLQGDGVSHAISLQLRDRDDHVLAELPLALTGQWSTARGVWRLAPGPVAADRLVLHYARPLGEAPLDGVIFLTGVRLSAGN